MKFATSSSMVCYIFYNNNNNNNNNEFRTKETNCDREHSNSELTTVHLCLPFMLYATEMQFEHWMTVLMLSAHVEQK